MMILECAAGGALVLLGLLLGVGLIRAAATAAVVLLAVAAIGFALFHILAGDWVGWFTIAWRCLATGLAAAALSLPLLPFTPFLNRGK